MRLQFVFGKIQEVNVATGSIKKVVADRGFGFIVAEDAKEYFFHRSGLDASLDFDRLFGGERVEFDVEQSPKGPRANHVRDDAMTFCQKPLYQMRTEKTRTLQLLLKPARNFWPLSSSSSNRYGARFTSRKWLRLVESVIRCNDGMM